MGKAVKAFYAKAKAGRCPCGRRIPPERLSRHGRLCGRRQCKRDYQVAYGTDRRAGKQTSLRRVVRIEPMSKYRSRAWVVLKCGHRTRRFLSQLRTSSGILQCKSCRRELGRAA